MELDYWLEWLIISFTTLNPGRSFSLTSSMFSPVGETLMIVNYLPTRWFRTIYQLFWLIWRLSRRWMMILGLHFFTSKLSIPDSCDQSWSQIITHNMPYINGSGMCGTSWYTERDSGPSKIRHVSPLFLLSPFLSFMFPTITLPIHREAVADFKWLRIEIRTSQNLRYSTYTRSSWWTRISRSGSKGIRHLADQSWKCGCSYAS